VKNADQTAEEFVAAVWLEFLEEGYGYKVAVETGAGDLCEVHVRVLFLEETDPIKLAAGVLMVMQERPSDVAGVGIVSGSLAVEMLPGGRCLMSFICRP